MHLFHKLSLQPSVRKQCPRCLWSGKFDQLLSQDDDDCQFEAISARRFKRGKSYDCFCCSMLSGFLESQGLAGRADVNVIRDEQSLLLKMEGDESSKEMLVYTTSSAGNGSTAQLPCLPRRSIVSGDTSSADALSWVQAQIHTCLNSHEHCQSEKGEFLPTRLLSVRSFSGSQDIQLVESQRLPASTRYVALSHCWGKYRMQCLTKQANLSQQLERVPWKSLTQTFQDAVDFTRRLGIDYIWIDSMCIIQDDKRDWLHEASMMFSVYNDAYVTLVGVHAEDGSVGLYSKGVVLQKDFPKTISLEGQDYQLWTCEKMAPFHDWRRLPPEAPLFTRAWCYQELIISQRVVFFTRQEILWECFSRASCECSGETPPSNYDIDNLKIHHFAALADEKYDSLRADVMDNTTATSFRLSELPSAASRGLSSEQMRREYRVHQWHSIVEQYSELELTKYTDRLPAIGGIAEHYHKCGIRAGERYLAGLWSGSLVEDLLWWANEVGRKRLGAEVAPSWSWASVTGGVQYFQVKTPLADILSVECQYADSGPFSVVSGGTLSLKGSTVILVLRNFNQNGKWSLEDPHYGEFTGLETFALDEETGSAYKDGQIVNAVAIAEEWDGRTMYLLLAECDRDVGKLERIGILFQVDTDDRRRDWRNNLSRESFEIV